MDRHGSTVVALGCVVAENKDLSTDWEEDIESAGGDKIRAPVVVGQLLLQVY